ncbi:MAG: hypothetical protein ACOYYS_00970 [Chloroflexota bacterium]
MQHFYELPTSLELSSDLEWMLQSGQVDDAILAMALLREYYGQVYSLFKNILDREEAVEDCVYRTFALAIARRHTYRAEMGIPNWLFSHALRAYQEVRKRYRLQRWLKSLPFLARKLKPVNASGTDSNALWLSLFRRLGEENRLMLWLHLVDGLSPAGLAKMYKQPEDVLQGSLTTNLTYLFFLARQSIVRGVSLQVEHFQEHLKEALLAHQHGQGLSEDEIYELATEIAGQTTQQKQRHITSISLKEMALGVALLAMASALWFFSNMADKSLATAQQPRATATKATRHTLTPSPAPTHTASSTPTGSPIPTEALPDGTGAIERFTQLRVPRSINPDTMSNSGPVAVSLVLQAWEWAGDPDRPLEAMQPEVQDRTVLPYEMIDFVERYTAYRMEMRLDGNPGLICNLVNAGYPVIVQRAMVTDTMGIIQTSVAYKVETTAVELEALTAKTGGITVTQSLQPASPPQGAGWKAGYEVITACDSDRFDFYTWRPHPSENSIVYSLLDVWELLRGWWAFDNAYYLIFPPEEETKVMWILAGQGSAYERDQSDGHTNFINAIETTSERIYSASTPLQRFYAWFNRGTALTYVDDYTWAAKAFDTAFEAYKEIPAQDRPWRMMWYNTRPYWAYFYTGRYQDVIDLATSTLESPGGDTLEESYYWRAMAYEALGDMDQALADLKMAVERNRMFTPGLEALRRLQSTQ